MALDVYSTPTMSDEPERVFSVVGNLMTPRCRCMKGEGVEQMTCSRSWERSGLISLNRGLFSAVVLATSIDEAEGDDEPVDPPLIQID
jgi:hypothetical protein